MLHSAAAAAAARATEMSVGVCVHIKFQWRILFDMIIDTEWGSLRQIPFRKTEIYFFKSIFHSHFSMATDRTTPDERISFQRKHLSAGVLRRSRRSTSASILCKRSELIHFLCVRSSISLSLISLFSISAPTRCRLMNNERIFRSCLATSNQP